MTSFASFEDFFPYYVAQHSKRATRWVHFAGTHLGALSAAAGMLTRRPRLIAAAPLISYGVAWASHLTIEGNRPATFAHPIWSLRGDLRMLGMMWQGRDRELQRIGHDTQASLAA